MSRSTLSSVFLAGEFLVSSPILSTHGMPLLLSIAVASTGLDSLSRKAGGCYSVVSITPNSGPICAVLWTSVAF